MSKKKYSTPRYKILFYDWGNWLLFESIIIFQETLFIKSLQMLLGMHWLGSQIL